MSLGKWFPTFRKIIDPEDEGNAILRNVGNYSPCDAASHPRRLQTEQVTLPCLEVGADCDVCGNVC